MMNRKNTPPPILFISLIFFLPVTVLLCASCSNGTDTNPPPTFVTQTADSGDNRCGAFSLAFYQWLEEGKTYSLNTAADYDVVNAIYSQLQFGPSYGSVPITGIGSYDLSSYSNPVKMLKYADTTLGNTSAEFYYDSSNTAMKAIYDEIVANDSGLHGDYLAKIKTGGIPSLNNGEYAIVVCLVQGLDDSVKGLHYVLFCKTADGYELYDPYFGKPISATQDQLTGDAPIFVTYPGIGDRKLTSMNTCLLLP